MLIAAGQRRHRTATALDTGFGRDGIVTTDLGGNDSVSDLQIQSDGKLVVAGWTCSTTCAVALARYR